MNRVKQLAPKFIIIYIFLYYLWIYVWKNNEVMVVVGGNIFQLIAPLIAFIWLFNTYLKTSNKDRNFWLLLSLGCLFYFVGQGIWSYHEIILRIPSPFPGWSDVFWLIQYVLYFFAFLFGIYCLRNVILKRYQVMEISSYGLSITVILLMTRLILTLVKNEELLLKQQQLTKDLSGKNIQLVKLNQTLSEKEQQLKDVFDNLDAVIWSRDLQTNTSIISTGVEKIFGYSPRDLIENTFLWKKAIHPDDIDKIDELDPILSPSKTSSLYEFRVIQPNNDIKWVQVLRTPIYDELGHLVKIHAVITDITDIKKLKKRFNTWLIMTS